MLSLHTENGYPITIPLSFHDYNYIRMLNKGGYCCVALVEHIYSNQKYAAKIIPKRYLEKENSIDMFFEEIKILQLLHHPNIIQFNEAFTLINNFEEEYFVIITEYCENGDLLDYIDRNDFINEEEKKEILKGILKAVQYLHKKGISHGDIKPENILLDCNFNPKICDFGFAKTSLICKDSKRKGTIRYASPEFFDKSEYNLLKSDLYSLGITFYVISEKAFPYVEDEEEFIIGYIKNGYLFIDPDDQLQNIVGRLTRTNPNDRATIDEIINDEYFNA